MCPGLELPLWEPRSLSSRQGLRQKAPAARAAYGSESLHRTRFSSPLQPVKELQSRLLQTSELGPSRFMSTCPACWPVQSDLVQRLCGTKEVCSWLEVCVCSPVSEDVQCWKYLWGLGILGPTPQSGPVNAACASHLGMVLSALQRVTAVHSSQPPGSLYSLPCSSRPESHFHDSPVALVMEIPG